MSKADIAQLAQFLSVLLRSSSVVTNQIMDIDESQFLTAILATGESYFLRILIADVVRELLFKGAEREPLKKSCSRPGIVDDFPLSQNGDSVWLSKIIDHLSGNDVARAFIGQAERIFRVQRLECDGNEYFESPSSFIATVSREISFLIPNGVDMLTLFSVPVSKSISLNRPASEPEPSTVLEIRYSGVEGDKFINGTKGAINTLAITLCDENAVEDFIRIVKEQQHHNVPDDLQSFPKTPEKHSIAFIELQSISGDGNHEKGARLDATAIPGTDASSPLRGISLRTRQKQVSTAAPVPQNHALEFEPSPSSNDKSAKDTPALNRLPVGKSLIERLRASQRNPKDVQPKDKVSSAQSQLGYTDFEADDAEDALPEEPSHQPSNAIDLASRTKTQDPYQSSPSTKSNLEHNADLASKPTSTSSKEGHKFEPPRKRPRHDQQGHSQASKIPAKTGLKRRTIKDSMALQNEQPQKPSKSAPEAAEFDLPPSTEEASRPTKKVKTKNSKAPTKASLKESAKMNGQNVQVAVSPKQHKQKAVKNKLTKPSGKKTQKTAASTRVRRVAKTPKYIEASDESNKDSSGEAFEEEEEPEEHGSHDIAEECAEDSLPLSKGALENALKASQFSFESNMRDIVDRDSTDREDRPAERSPTRDPVDEQAAPTPSSVTRSTGHEQTPVRKEMHVTNPPGAEAVSEDNQDSMNDGQQKSTPRRNTKRLSESSIPPVSEKLLRKTKIVHFGPHGPDNQVLPKSPITLVKPETTNETSPEAEHLGLGEGEVVQDIDELVPDYSPEHISRSREIKEALPSFTHDGGDISEELIGGEDADTRALAGNTDEQVIEHYDELRTIISNDQKASESVISGAEEAADQDSLRVPDPRSSHRTDTQQMRLQGALPADEVFPYYASGAKGPQNPQEPTRQCVGFSSIQDQQYPRSPTATTSELQAGHQTTAMEEVSRSRTSSTVPFPVPERIMRSKKSERTHGSAEVLPVPVLPAVLAERDNIYRNTIKSRQANLLTIPQRKCEPPTPLMQRMMEPMGPPPPPTVPFRSVDEARPLRKSWPAAQVDRQTALLQKPMDEPPEPVTAGPVRVKKSLSLPLAGNEPVLEPDLPPATPASFSTRLNLHFLLADNVIPDNEGLKMMHDGDTGQNVGDDSLTLVKGDETAFGNRLDRGFGLGREQRSESGDDSPVMTSPLHKTDEGVRRGDSMLGMISARDSQRGLLDAIVNITNDVLFRFGAEEDGVKAKVDQYDCGGNKVIQTLTDTWDQRMGHERRILGDTLKSEKEVLATALQLVEDGQQSGGAWRETVYNQELAGKIREKRDILVRKIERLRNRG
ncbi:uncharacterized protein Z520_06581 [Fonsecaea multimorphosa CBS 102226]|uniref:Uncharacterized protein n=1 Tax=Fonsecaea multimorphosa CBS 102226 TaxID=1442371 RepID=A0A0D2KM86_9EURO|nr:uncharacterized protein Z520_06581 [Fonsecaea multimorphosa CBS 102226]KIX97803.1 hypothetical protein Z520_06581 [Fonsecaea multimorphosa CBS 102226]OAL23823.1 hypothetical protein AYO22_06142 [Fonsecaea multimorphosa]